MMKIAISSENNSLDSYLDARFGRAAGFVIYDLTTEEYSYINNEKNLNATQGAGIQTAQYIADAKVDAVITGYCGPKAYKVLESAKIKIYTSPKVTIKSAVEKFRNNELTEQAKDF